MRTNIDTDAALSMLLKWECEFTIGGKDYSLHPLSLAEVAALDALPQKADEAIKTIEGMFNEPRPDLSKLTVPKWNLLVLKIAEAVRDHSRKNLEALARILSAGANPNAAGAAQSEGASTSSKPCSAS